MRNLWVKDGSTWKLPKNRGVYYKNSGIWKLAKRAFIKINSAWELVYAEEAPAGMIGLVTSGTVSALPSDVISAGWQVSDGTNGTTDMTDGFLAGDSTKSTTLVGSDTHDHGTFSGSTGGCYNSNNSLARRDDNPKDFNGLSWMHTHSYTSVGSSVNHEPKHRTAIPVVGGFAVTPNMLMFLDDTSIPTGWALNTAYVDNYVKMATDGITGIGGAWNDQGGRSSHEHIETGTIGNVNSWGTYRQLDAATLGFKVNQEIDHTHTDISHYHFDNPIPQNLQQQPISPSSNVYITELPSGVAAFFIDGVPSGWTSHVAMQDDRLVWCTDVTDQVGDVNGTLTHDNSSSRNSTNNVHACNLYEVTADTANAATGGSNRQFVDKDYPHHHIMTHSHPDSATHMPRRRKLYYAVKD